MTQSATKMHQVRNLARSAIAPLMSAGVMIANMSWKPAKASSGMPYTPPLLVSWPNASPSPDTLNEP